MSDNRCLPFLGGTIEQVPAGEMQGVDQNTGQPRTFTWSNHIRVVSRLGKAKLNCEACKAIAKLLDEDPDFAAWVEKCK
jgi:hypothetical protein